MGNAEPLLEKDFSPTLAGDVLADERNQILRWLREVPARVRAAAPAPIRLALKLMNARFDDAFQLEMMDAARPPMRWCVQPAVGSGAGRRVWGLGPERAQLCGCWTRCCTPCRAPSTVRRHGQRLLRPYYSRLRPAWLRERPAAHLLPAAARRIPRDATAPDRSARFTRCFSTRRTADCRDAGARGIRRDSSDGGTCCIILDLRLPCGLTASSCTSWRCRWSNLSSYREGRSRAALTRCRPVRRRGHTGFGESPPFELAVLLGRDPGECARPDPQHVLIQRVAGREI